MLGVGLGVVGRWDGLDWGGRSVGWIAVGVGIHLHRVRGERCNACMHGDHVCVRRSVPEELHAKVAGQARDAVLLRPQLWWFWLKEGREGYMGWVRSANVFFKGAWEKQPSPVCIPPPPPRHNALDKRRKQKPRARLPRCGPGRRSASRAARPAPASRPRGGS